MKKLILLTLLMAPLMLVARDQPGNIPVRKGADGKSAIVSNKLDGALNVFRLVPHLAVNEEWVSELTIRSDENRQLCLRLMFFAADGLPIEATFYDSFGNQYVGDGFDIPDLNPFEIYSLDFDQLAGARNLQVFVYTNEQDTNYGLEGAYHRLSGTRKVASVGVAIEAPGHDFIINMDHRFDPNTGARRFRGMAISNTSEDTCHCTANLFNNFGGDLDPEGHLFPSVNITIPPSGKWLGTSYDLLFDMDKLLGDGIGYMLFTCDRDVAPLGLAFENASTVATSVPIDYFVSTKHKESIKQRVPRK